MKKILVFVLSLMLCLLVCGCGNNKATGEIGQTYTSNGIEFTLNYVEFTDTMDNWGGANDTYWQPLPEDLTGADRNRIANAVSPQSEDDTICVISYTAKNVSKTDKTIDDRGTIDYDNGYTYSDGGLTYRVSSTGVWSDIPNGLSLKKLKEDAYEFRAYIIVPKVVVTETDKSLTYTLFGEKFDLR